MTSIKPQMSMEAFLAILSRTPRDWVEGPYGQFRRETTHLDCPITAVFNNLKAGIFPALNFTNFDRAGYLIGLTTDQIHSIVYAADNNIGWNLRKWLLRRQLRKACGL